MREGELGFDEDLHNWRQTSFGTNSKESIEFHRTQKSCVKLRDRCNTSTLGQDVNLREKFSFDPLDSFICEFSAIYVSLNYKITSNHQTW